MIKVGTVQGGKWEVGEVFGSWADSVTQLELERVELLSEFRTHCLIQSLSLPDSMDRSLFVLGLW